MDRNIVIKNNASGDSKAAFDVTDGTKSGRSSGKKDGERNVVNEVLSEERRNQLKEEKELVDILQKLAVIDKAASEAEPSQPAKERNLHCPTLQFDLCLRPFQVIE